MPRKPNPAPESKAAPFNQEVYDADSQAANALAVISREQESKAQALAAQLGYDGSLVIGALEDEIRFYQRRTVEALLETGKRLLVLRELTPHGEFEARVRGLGFSERTAQRFMQAAVKTSKSANLALLAGQVQSASVFLELVTHDDDVLENLAELDAIDKMSASQLREALRKEKLVVDRLKQVSDELNTELALSKKKKVAVTEWPERFSVLMDQAAAAQRAIKANLAALEAVRATAMEDQAQNEAEEASLASAREALAEQVASAIAQAAQHVDRLNALFEKTLGAYLPEGAFQ